VKTPQLVSSDEKELNTRLFWLAERFRILTFLDYSGVKWAIETLEHEKNWTRANYIHAYNGEGC